VDGTPTELILAEGLTSRPGQKQPMLILRRRASQTRFLTVLEPIRAEQPLEAVRVGKSGSGSGRTVFLQSPQGVREVAIPGIVSDRNFRT